MTFRPETAPNYAKIVNYRESCRETENEPILCQHCRRTASNGIKCKGMCVADSDY